MLKGDFVKYFYEIKEALRNEFSIRSSLTFAAHLQSEIEIIYVKEGNPIAYVEGYEYNLKKGDALIIYPNQLHAFENNGNVLSSVIIINPDIYPELGSTVNGKVPSTPLIKAEKLNASGFNFLHDLAYEKFKNGSAAVKKGAILLTVGTLFSFCTLRPAKQIASGILYEVFDYCRKNYMKKFTLSDMARDLHVSGSYLSHVFSEQIHMRFNDYINSMRINQACSLLEQKSKNITDIADMCGFGSIRTFNRVFLKITGETPSEYIKK